MLWRCHWRLLRGGRVPGKKIKLTTSPYCTPMIIMVTSGKTSKVSMVLLHRKPWWTKFVNKWPQKEEAYCYSRAVILIPVSLNPIYRMPNPIFAAWIWSVMMRWLLVTTNLIIPWVCCVNKRSGRSSRYCPPISIRKVRNSGYSSLMLCLISKV